MSSYLNTEGFILAVTYRKAVIQDIDILAPILREQDKHEVWCSHGVNSREALQMSFLNSTECYSIIEDHLKLVGMFGVVNQGNGVGMPWMLASDDLPKKENVATFLPQGKSWVEGLQKKYQQLYNYAHAENHTSLKWLKWLGFDCNEVVQEWGYHPSTFVRFVWEKEG